MLDLILLPFVELLLVDFLRDQDEITAFVGDNIYTELPARFDDWPAVRVTRYGGVPVTRRPLWLDAATVQLDAFGGPKKTAFDIAATCRAAMAQRLIGVHDEGVVTGVDFGALAYVPDDLDPGKAARPRYLFSSTIWVHPNPAAGS